MAQVMPISRKSGFEKTGFEKNGYEKTVGRRDGGEYDEAGLDEEAMKNMPNTVGPNPNIYGGFPENDIWGNFELPAPETLDKLKQALGSHGATGVLFMLLHDIFVRKV